MTWPSPEGRRLVKAAEYHTLKSRVWALGFKHQLTCCVTWVSCYTSLGLSVFMIAWGQGEEEHLLCKHVWGKEVRDVTSQTADHPTVQRFETAVASTPGESPE